jgi:hypothetical protein
MSFDVDFGICNGHGKLMNKFRWQIYSESGTTIFF